MDMICLETGDCSDESHDVLYLLPPVLIRQAGLLLQTRLASLEPSSPWMPATHSGAEKTGGKKSKWKGVGEGEKERERYEALLLIIKEGQPPINDNNHMYDTPKAPNHKALTSPGTYTPAHH